MKKILLTVFLSSLALADVSLTRPQEIAIINSKGIIERQNGASWEDVSYTLLNELARSQNALNQCLQPKKEVKKDESKIQNRDGAKVEKRAK